ncbi:MAG TPA: BatD family protein [bacterium]|nr:BatD family protein [bacterium]
MIRKIGLTTVLLAFLIPLGHAEDVRVTSTLNKRTAQVEEEINLTIRVTGSKGNLQAPRLPGFKGFDTYYTGRASHITFINNVSTNSVEFSYVLIPREAGKFTLDPIEISVGPQVYRTDPVVIEVQGGRGTVSRTATRPTAPSPAPQAPPPPLPTLPPSSPTRQESAPGFKPEDDNIFVKAWVDKLTVYQNEQILLTYSLYTRYDTRYEGFMEEPEISGFWIEEFPMEREITRETVRVDGKRYVKADVRKIALFPTTAAEYTIRPGILKASVREEPRSDSVFDEFFNDSFFSGSGFFSRRENRLLKPPPILLVVKPLPEEGKPANFQGAVGNFRMSATVDRRTVKQNEPITMKLVIEGEGNIETLKQPELPELDNFKVYESDTSSQLFKTGNVIGGRKTFEIVFIPTKPGSLAIPGLSFSYFDPRQARYQTLSSQEFQVQIEPSDQPFQLPSSLSQQEIFKKDIQVEGQDIRYIREKLPDVRPRKILSWVDRGLMGADILLALLVLIGLMQHRQQKIFAKDVALKRRKLAKSQARSRMRHLKRLGRSHGRQEVIRYYEEIDKTLTQYLSDKLNLSAYGVTRRDLEAEMESIFGKEDPLYQDILELYGLCDEARFGRGDVPSAEKNEALKILQLTIGRLEKVRR